MMLCNNCGRDLPLGSAGLCYICDNALSSKRATGNRKRTPDEYGPIIDLLRRNPGGMTVAEISDNLSMSKDDVTKGILCLRSADLVKRKTKDGKMHTIWVLY